MVGVVDNLVVNCRPEQTAAFRAALDDYDHSITIAGDSERDEGLMVGVMTGSRAVEAEYTFVTVRDIPSLEPTPTDRLFERTASHDTVVSRADDGWFQSTRAVYRALSMADARETALAGGSHRITDPLSTLDYVIPEESEMHGYASLDTLENISTPDEFTHAAEQLH